MWAIGEPQVGDSDDTGKQMYVDLYNKGSLNLPKEFFIMHIQLFV